MRVLRAGHNSIYFTGLKLNKMGPIKNELHWKKSNKMTAGTISYVETNEGEFCLQFKVGTKTLHSDPFKLSSSCSQLPGEVILGSLI